MFWCAKGSNLIDTILWPSVKCRYASTTIIDEEFYNEG